MIEELNEPENWFRLALHRQEKRSNSTIGFWVVSTKYRGPTFQRIEFADVKIPSPYLPDQYDRRGDRARSSRGTDPIHGRSVWFYNTTPRPCSSDRGYEVGPVAEISLSQSWLKNPNDRICDKASTFPKRPTNAPLTRCQSPSPKLSQASQASPDLHAIR